MPRGRKVFIIVGGFNNLRWRLDLKDTFNNINIASTLIGDLARASHPFLQGAPDDYQGVLYLPLATASGLLHISLKMFRPKGRYASLKCDT